MNNLKKNILAGIVLAVILFSIAGLVGWLIFTSEITPTHPITSTTATPETTPAPSNSEQNYTLTDNGEKGIDVRLDSKTPFVLNFPVSLNDPLTIALDDNQKITITQKDGTGFSSLPKNQNPQTTENAKLLSIIQKDPTLTAYRDAQGNFVFYTYQKIDGEQKQSLFKNWILFNSPPSLSLNQSSNKQTLAYIFQNATANIDSDGDAQIYFDDGRGVNSRESDFTIPKPYFLDKDGQKTELIWQFDKISRVLSVSFEAKKEQYPIALDPSVLKTDTTIATFSGKAIAMSAACGTSLSCGNSCVYNGDSYGTVLIGAQCWMRDNMMTTKYPDGSDITRGPVGATWDGADHAYYAYPPNTANTAEETLANIQTGKLGFVYQWSAAMYGSSTAGAQGICPNGWHVPTHDEYTTLERAVCTSGTCATDFPFDTTTTGWRGTNEGSKLSLETSGGTNSSGFTAHLAGYRDTTGGFYSRSSSAALWSSLPSGGNAWSRVLYSGVATVYRSPNSKANGFSVRCLKN